MFITTKPFDKKLYLFHDPKSREVVKCFLNKNGMDVIDNPDKYGVDLISTDESFQIELEHRPPWKNEKFPFDEVNILRRKEKFFKDGLTHYIIISNDYSHIGIIFGKIIQSFIFDDNLIENKNKEVAEGELFYKVPREKFIFRCIK